MPRIAAHVQPADEEPPLHRRLRYEICNHGNAAEEVIREAKSPRQVRGAPDRPLNDELEHSLGIAVREVQGHRPTNRYADEVKAVDSQLVGQGTYELAVSFDRRGRRERLRAAEAGQVRSDRVIARSELGKDVAEHPRRRPDPPVEEDERPMRFAQGSSFAEEGAATVEGGYAVDDLAGRGRGRVTRHSLR